MPFNPRRGYPGDAHDTAGQLIGSRNWLIHRAKRTERTRQLVISYSTEGTAWIETTYACEVDVDAEWIAPRTLGLGVRVDNQPALSVPLAIS